MATRGPTTKRILKEASDLASHPSPDFHATPLETNLHEWHFTLRGAPAPSAFAGGLYHGRIVLPPSYPLRPPSFRFLTPSGRFEVNREICLSITGFHEETWQPAWGIRTALIAIRSFMDADDGAGAVGGLRTDDGVRRKLAAASAGWRCAGCGRSNAEVMEENAKRCAEVEQEGQGQVEDKVPDELRLGYRDELGGGSPLAGSSSSPKEESAPSSTTQATPLLINTSTTQSLNTSSPLSGRTGQVDTIQSAQPHTGERGVQIPAHSGSTRSPQGAAVAAGAHIPSRAQVQVSRTPVVETPWLDKAIIGVAGALALMLIRALFF